MKSRVVTLYVILTYPLLCLYNCSPKELDSSEIPLFSQVKSSESRLIFENMVVESIEANHFAYEYVYNGGGIAIGDINNDGLEDIYMVGNQVSDKLFLNSGNLTFEDITKSSGISMSGDWRTGVTMADVNGDGWLDIYVSRSGWFREGGPRSNLLFINNQDLTFTESSASYGLDDSNHNMQATFFDYDKDGDLDMYAMGHPVDMFGLKVSIKEYLEMINQGKIESDRLYENNNGTFVDVSESAGISDYGFGLGVVAVDINNDGWTDIYVTNDYEEPDILYINNRDGTFTDKLREMTQHISNYSMGADIADYNNDLLTDIFTADMSFDTHERSKRNMPSMSPSLFWTRVIIGWHYQYMSNTLQLNNGNGTFSEIAQLAGVNKTDWSWAAFFADLDRDGYKDLTITNGIKKDIFDNDAPTIINAQAKNGEIKLDQLLDLYPSSKRANYLFRNRGDLTFNDVSSEWGFTEEVNSNGAAYADLDRDGDLDIVINNIDDNVSLYENHSNELDDHHYIAIKINGIDQNTEGIGTKVYIWSGNLSTVQEVQPTRGYISRVTSDLFFGLGNNTSIDSILIEWPDLTYSIIRDVDIDQRLELDQSKLESQPRQRLATNTKQIMDIASTLNLNLAHQENSFDDYKKQVLLPHSYAQNGPALSIGDIDNNGTDDLYFGGAHGLRGQLLGQNAKGKFELVNGPWEQDYLYEDISSLFFDSDNDGDMDLYVVSGGFEHEEGHQLYQDRLYLNNGDGTFVKDEGALPDLRISGQSIVSGDIDNDGDLDLFVGGRVLPWKYPKEPASYLLINTNGKFSVAQNQPDQFEELGMVTDAELIDMDYDDDLDLIVVGEWMHPMIFENDDGEFVDASDQYGLTKAVGWWYSLIAGDFDSDGDIDFVAGNLGLNNKFKASEKKPLHIYYDDFDGNESFDPILAHVENDQILPYRGRECSSE